MGELTDSSTRVRRSLAIVFLNRYAVLIVGFVSTMVLARLVAPAETGLFSVAASVVLLAQSIRDFGIAEFLVQEQELTSAKIRTAFGMTLILAWSLGIGIFLSRHWVAALYGTPELATLIAIVCGSFLIAPFSSTALAVLNREMRFNMLLRISLASNVANASVSIGFAYLGWGSIALSLGMLAMNVTTAATAMMAMRSWDHCIPSLREWRRLASFGLHISSSNVIAQLSSRFPDLFIGRFLGYQPLGLYNRANGIVSIFNDMIVSGAQTVAFPTFAAAHRDGRNLHESYLKTATLISGAALPILAVAAVGARPLVLCLLGPNWTGVIHLVPPLAFSYAEALAAPMVGLYLSATGWVRLVPRLAIGLQLSQILCISVSVHFGIYWVAVASITAGLLSFIVNSHYLRRATGITRSQLLFSLWKSVAVTIICLVPAVAMIHLLMIDEHPWLSLMVGGVVSACTWLIAITLVRHPIAGELRLFLRDVRRLPPWRTV